MPLVRFQVRNEYGLGSQELYRGVTDEDPKGLLEGVTVSGLVGILRQLGDLAEFASEVFHDLQEQVMTTAARSHKMIARVQHMEASIPAIEKAVLAQKSHIHFAYTNGSEWHPKIQKHRNHLIYSDLPRFIMDTYEECRDPPCFHLLDKFDKGGPGSCLRRYSDPSFFKRAVASSEMLSGDKVQREKKAQKSRKKKLRQRDAEVSHGVSISGRIHFASPTSYVQSSTSDTVSTFDMRSKSELGDRSASFDPRTLDVRFTSFDSRTKLSYHEYVFDASSPIRHEDQHDDQEYNELYTSRSKLQANGTGSILVDERDKGEYDDLTDWSSLDSSVPKSSPATWDEKTEIVKPIQQQLKRILENQGKASQSLPSSSDPSKLETGAPTLTNIGAVDILSDSGNVSGSILDGNQSDGVESEPDSYMDALNTMESEMETDAECQTKREVELSLTKFKKRGMECETGPVHRMSAQTSESSDLDTHSSPYSSSSKQISQNLSKSISSEDVVHAQPPQVNGRSSDPYVSVDTGSSGGTDPHDISRERDAESAINDPSSSGTSNPYSLNPLTDKIVNQLGGPGESPAKTSDAPSIKIWTNGGLLGLQPSKPPDFSVANVESRDSTPGTKDDERPLSSETTPAHEKKNPNSGGGFHCSLDNLNLSDLSHVRKTGNIVQNIDDQTHSKPRHNNQDDDVSKKISGDIELAVSESKIETSGLSHRSSSINNTQGDGLTETIILKTGLLKLQDHHIKQEGRNRAVCQTSPEKNPNKQIDQGSPVNSVSSPPLEHMKISVHPINVSETSILKLKFPDGHRVHGSNKDFMLPSFQLLPELSTSLQGIGYESDDDTFYRSSPDMSEELMSQGLDSNSEQWESEETPRSSKDPEIYDVFHRISTDESISSTFQHEGKIANDEISRDSDRSPTSLNSIRQLQNSPLLEFPSFDDFNQLTSKEERKIESVPKASQDSVLQYSNISTQLPNEPTPPPPPLPPLEWIVMKPNHASEEIEQATVSKAVSRLNSLQLPRASPVQQLKPARSEQQRSEMATASPSYSKDQQKLKRSIETTLASDGKDLDEREDLLHQIRSKSFNLRRTTPSRPTVIAGPFTNTSVAEILQKATAIRQAFVDSDDGEDNESWSEG